MSAGAPDSIAFVPQYRYDVFISYAHADESPRDHRVSRFAAVLATELGQRLGRPAAMWFDADRLEAGSRLEDTVRYDLSRTAVVLRLSSPSYYNSGYCSLEREWFESGAGALDPLVIDSQSRSIECVLRPDPENPPDPNSIYATLHDANGTPLDPDDRAFEPIRDKLAAAIERMLRSMASRRPAAYVPYGGADIEPARQQLLAELHAGGYRGIPPSNAAFSLTKTLDELGQCPLAVFLLGRFYLPDLKQRLNAATGKKPVIVWMNPDADMEDAQVEFADALRSAPPGEVLVQNSVEDLLQRVRTRLNDGVKPTLTERVKAAVPQPGGAARRVFFLCKPVDRVAADGLVKAMEQAGLTVLLPEPADAGVSAQRVDEIAKFSQVSGVLIFAQSQAPTWFDQQLRKLANPAMGARIADAVAMLNPPPKPDMIQSATEKGFGQGRPERLLVLADGQVQAGQLDPFLQLLRTGAAP